MSTTAILAPNWRDELIDDLRDIADRETFVRWLNDPASARGRNDLGFIINFVFDTLRVEEKPEDLTGLVLYNDDELRAVIAFAREFDNVLGSSMEKTALVLLTNPDWSSVMEAARNALQVLTLQERH